MRKVGRKLASAAVAVALGGMASAALAGGFAIGTQSGSGTGNAFAGGAAAADDASVAWYNPALMTLLPGKQVAGALHALKPSFKFSNSGSTGVFLASGTGDGGDGGDWAYVPNGFFTMAINPKWSFGLALNAPFGLMTEYDDGWRGRLTALKSEVKSVNANPSVAYKVSDTVSIGGGLSLQYLDAKLTNDATAFGLGIVSIKADDIGYGFNLGVIFQPSPSTRFGMHYRSKIKYELEGTLTASLNPAANSDVTADLKVPDSLSLSVFHTLNPKWELMGDITWTGWSSLQQLAIVRTSGPAAGTTFTTLQFQWDDTWRYGVGVNYKWDNQTKIRFGLAFDETPTNDQFRTPRLPDEDRTWVALGVQYKPSKTSIVDIGYAHEFIKDAKISTSQAPLSCPVNCLNGTFKNQADIISIQYSQSF